MMMFIAFSHTRQKAHLLFSVFQSGILQTEQYNSGSVFGAVPDVGLACAGPGSVSHLAPGQDCPCCVLLLGTWEFLRCPQTS